MLGIGCRVGRTPTVVAVTLAEAEATYSRQLAHGAQFHLEVGSVTVFKEWHLARLVGISAVAELLYPTEKRSIVDERTIDILVLSVGTEGETLRVAVVYVVSAETEPRRQGGIEACRKAQVHELVLMAQVFVLGIVGGRIVQAHTQGIALPHVDTDGTSQPVGITMLATGVVSGSLGNVEWLADRVDPCRSGHVVARIVVVADVAVDYRSAAEPIESLRRHVSLQHAGRLVVTGQPTLCQRQGDRCLCDIGSSKAGQRSRIAGRQPRVCMLHILVVAHEQRVLG